MACFLVPPVHQNRFLSLRQFLPETCVDSNPKSMLDGSTASIAKPVAVAP